MQKHHIVRKTKNYTPATVGRGGKRGKTSGRGTKGQKARAGRKLRPELRDIIKRLPKKRGYFFKSIAAKPAVVNLSLVSARFEKGETVSPVTLVEKNIVRAMSGSLPSVKILGDGELTKSLLFSGVTVSNPARVKIEKAGGTISN